MEGARALILPVKRTLLYKFYPFIDCVTNMRGVNRENFDAPRNNKMERDAGGPQMRKQRDAAKVNPKGWSVMNGLGGNLDRKRTASREGVT